MSKKKELEVRHKADDAESRREPQHWRSCGNRLRSLNLTARRIPAFKPGTANEFTTRGNTAQGCFDFVGHNHAVIDRAQPPRHDDAHRAGVIQPRNLPGKVHAYLQPLELRTERCPHGLHGVAVEGFRRGGFDVVELAPDIGEVFFQSPDGRFDQVMIGNGLISHGLKNQLIGAYRPGQEALIKIVAQTTDELLALVGMEPGKGFVIRRVFRYELV